MQDAKKDIAGIAKEYLGRGFSVIPSGLDSTGKRRPSLSTWVEYQQRRMTEAEIEKNFASPQIRSISEVSGITLVCGKVSDGLEVIDVDVKNDPTRSEDHPEGTLWAEFWELIREHLPERAGEFVIVETKSKGRHILYRFAEPERGRDLASRPAMDGEKGPRPMIELKAEGWSIPTPPTPGYTLRQGSYDALPVLTQEERSILLGLAESFDRLPSEPEKTYTSTPVTQRRSNSVGMSSPFEAYNSSDDFVRLLERDGWTYLYSRRGKKYFLRPGKTGRGDAPSANFDEVSRRFHVFSSGGLLGAGSQDNFSPSDIFAIIEAGLDPETQKSELAKALIAAGYGEENTQRRGDTMPNLYPLIHTPASVDADGLGIELEKAGGETVTLAAGESLTSQKIREIGPVKARVSFSAEEDRGRALDAVRLLDAAGSVRTEVSFDGETQPSWLFRFFCVLVPYDPKCDEEGRLSELDADALLRELVEEAGLLKDSIDRQRFEKRLETDLGLASLGITSETISEAVENVRRKNAETRQRIGLRDAIARASESLEKGHHSVAFSGLREDIRDLEQEKTAGLVSVYSDPEIIKQKLATTPKGLRTGFSQLDELIRFSPGTLSYVAGRTSHGKTTLMLNLLLRFAEESRRDGSSVLFFSFEEEEKRLYVKLLNMLQGKKLATHFVDGHQPTNFHRLMHYFADREEVSQYERDKDESLREQIAESQGMLDGLMSSGSLGLIDSVGLSVETLRSTIERANKTRPVKAVFIDYVQKLDTDAKTQDLRTKVGHVSNVLLRTAVDNSLPLIVGAQLNRQAASKSAFDRPMLHHLQESGNLEQDANTVLSVFDVRKAEREDEEQKQRSETAPRSTEQDEKKKSQRHSPLEVTTLKNREGETGRTAVLFLDGYSRRLTDTPWEDDPDEFFPKEGSNR